MASSSELRTIVVLGATGNQGGGVVRELLKSGKWHIRAGTRDPTSPKAQSLLQESSGNLELVKVHPYQIETLREAFVGAYGVFAITGEVHPDKKLIHEHEMTHEIEAGRNIVQASVECNLQHFVFSSLPDMKKVTGGRYTKIYHMDNKHDIEEIAREHLGQKVTCLIPGFFYTNLRWPQYSQRQGEFTVEHLRKDGSVKFVMPIASNHNAQWSDPGYDMGTYAARVFDLGPDTTGGKTYYPMSESITPQQMAETFTRVTGQQAYHDPITAERWGEMVASIVGPAIREDGTQMMKWAAEAPQDKMAYGSRDPAPDGLGLVASSFEEWLHRSGWKGPSHG